MKNLFIGAVALATVIACSKETAEQSVADAPKEPRSGVIAENMDKSVRPGEDFFSYVNGVWVDETEIPADKSSFSVFASLNDEAQDNVKIIIEESSTGDFAKGSDEQKVGDLYRSFMDMDTRDAKGVNPLQPELDRIDAISDHEDLAVYFAEVVKRNLDAPFGFSQFADLKDPKHYAMYLGQSGLGLPDREYYLKEDDASAELRNKYVVHIEKMFDLAGLAEGAAAAKTIMALETRLAEKNMTKEDSRNWSENYNKVALEDLPALMPKFNWDGYLAEGGLQDLDALVFITTDYLKAVDGIVADTDLETWKTYLRWTALNNTAGRLTSEIDNQNFAFYGTTLSGTEEQKPMWRRGVGVVNGSLGEVVGKVYVKRHFPPEAKERMLGLVSNLVTAYEKSIQILQAALGEVTVPIEFGHQGRQIFKRHFVVVPATARA